LAVKESDGVSSLYLPIEPTLLWRVYDAAVKRGATQTLGTFRALRWAGICMK